MLIFDHFTDIDKAKWDFDSIGDALDIGTGNLVNGVISLSEDLGNIDTIKRNRTYYYISFIN